jgi:hypothetical protein
VIIDDETIAAYDRDAAQYADDWESQPAPSDLHDVARRFFTPGLTADIGCGSGAATHPTRTPRVDQTASKRRAAAPAPEAVIARGRAKREGTLTCN